MQMPETQESNYRRCRLAKPDLQNTAGLVPSTSLFLCLLLYLHDHLSRERQASALGWSTNSNTLSARLCYFGLGRGITNQATKSRSWISFCVPTVHALNVKIHPMRHNPLTSPDRKACPTNLERVHPRWGPQKKGASVHRQLLPHS